MRVFFSPSLVYYLGLLDSKLSRKPKVLPSRDVKHKIYIKGCPVNKQMCHQAKTGLRELEVTVENQEYNHDQSIATTNTTRKENKSVYDQCFEMFERQFGGPVTYMLGKHIAFSPFQSFLILFFSWLLF